MNDLRTNQHAKCQSLSQRASDIVSRLNSSTVSEERQKVAEKQSELEQTLAKLIDSGLEREKQIASLLSLIEYERECEITQDWLNKERLEASSQEFGRDFEHAELLFIQFTGYMERLATNAERIQRIDNMARAICQNHFTTTVQIERVSERCSLIDGMWKELNSLIELRRRSLEETVNVFLDKSFYQRS